MKKIFLILLFTLLSVSAVELEWTSSYKQALVKAKKEKKNIMLLVTSESCGWCRKLEKTTLKDKAVIERLEKDYIVVHATRGEGKYPEALKVGSVPATFFMDENGRLIINRVVGYWSAEDYLSYMDDVDYKLGKKKY